MIEIIIQLLKASLFLFGCAFFDGITAGLFYKKHRKEFMKLENSLDLIYLVKLKRHRVTMIDFNIVNRRYIVNIIVILLAFNVIGLAFGLSDLDSILMGFYVIGFAHLIGILSNLMTLAYYTTKKQIIKK